MDGRQGAFGVLSLTVLLIVKQSGCAICSFGDPSGIMKHSDAEEAGSKELRWAIVVSIGWIVALTLSAYGIKNCAPDSPRWNPLGRMFSCLEPNELGDLLAGAFAPLAFLWLVATVWIQSRELKAQRKELALTRKEFEQNRKVAEETRREIAEQAEAARRNAEFVGKQTELLDLQYQKQLQDAVDQEFKQLLGQLNNFLAVRFHRKAKWLQTSQNLVREFLAIDCHGDVHECLSKRIGDFIKRVKLAREEGLPRCQINQHTIKLIRALCEQADRLCERQNDVSISLRVLAANIRLEELHATANEVLEKMEHYEWGSRPEP